MEKNISLDVLNRKNEVDSTPSGSLEDHDDSNNIDTEEDEKENGQVEEDEDEDNKGVISIQLSKYKLDLGSIRSSPRTGILSLIMFNSGQK